MVNRSAEPMIAVMIGRRVATEAPARRASLTQRLAHEADSEHRLFAFVQQFHVPFGVLFQAARNAAEQVAAHLGHLGPGGFVACEFSGLFRSARIPTHAKLE